MFFLYMLYGDVKAFLEKHNQYSEDLTRVKLPVDPTVHLLIDDSILYLIDRKLSGWQVLLQP